MTHERWLTAQEVADQLGMSRKTVYFHTAAGHLTVRRIGRALRYDPRSLDVVTSLAQPTRRGPHHTPTLERPKDAPLDSPVTS